MKGMPSPRTLNESNSVERSAGALICKLNNVCLSLVTFVVVGSWSIRAEAQFEGAYQGAVKKEEEKKNSRWSLAEWLAQKQKNQMMDLWLVKNSQSSPFEFYVDVTSVNSTQEPVATGGTSINRNTYGGSVSAYAGVAGLRGTFESEGERSQAWTGSLNLRLFGQALQDTHVNLEYGLRGLDLKGAGGSEKFQNQYGGVTVNLYLTKYFGLEGAYRKFFPAESQAESQAKTSLEGESSIGGVFIDFGLLRVFGSWRKDYSRIEDPSGQAQGPTSEGFGGGLRLYF